MAGDVVRVHRELLAHDRDDGLLVLLDRDRVLDRERRARSAGAESDDRGVDLTRELVDLLAVARRGLADLRAGLDRDRLRAVAPQVLVPDARDQLPRAPGPVGAQADREAGQRPIEAEGRCAHVAGGRRGRAPNPDRVRRAHASTRTDICGRIQSSREWRSETVHGRDEAGQVRREVLVRVRDEQEPNTTSSTPEMRSSVGPIRRMRSANAGDDARPSAASRNGTPMPAAYATSNSVPCATSPVRAAIVSAAASSGPTHGLQPAPNATPTT